MVPKKSTDTIMKKLLWYLVRDFRSVNGTGYFNNFDDVFAEGVKGYRAYKWPARCQAPIALFKHEAQLENLFKRYRFKDDVFSSEELLETAVEKFTATQRRIAAPLDKSPLVLRVLREARDIISDVLGQYDPLEHMDLCRFGKRACAQVPYSKSYLDFKLGTPITGSEEHIRWFKSYIEDDQILESAICDAQALPAIKYSMCETLTLSFVPKSFKSLRTIKPPTLIGSFYTYGLGRVLQNRLLKKGLDIRRLQDTHRRLVKTNSQTRRLVTADLSAASDSLSEELLYELLPYEWYRTVMYGVIRNIAIPGYAETIELRSVATMGDGHTFPLQTLVFYGLLKAIVQLSGNPDSFVSVYGDDLIYPRGIHRYVRCIFPKLHLLLNGDKTYVKDFFRESCGSDYYHGVDVRPFQPEGEYQLLGGQHLAVFLYKLYNGLTLRWAAEEIPQTLDFIRSELLSCTELIFQVPPSFPDGAGIHVATIERGFPWSPVVYDCNHKMAWVFNYLHVVAGFRPVENLYPYYWECLRSKTMNVSVVDPWDQGDEPVIRWEKTKPPKYFIRNGMKVRRLVAGVSSKTKHRVLGDRKSVV